MWWDLGERSGCSASRPKGAARLGIVALVGLASLVTPGEVTTAAAQDRPAPSCRARVERVEIDEFQAAVRAERETHLANDFRIDGLHQTLLGADTYDVPNDVSKFWDAPVPVGLIEQLDGYGYRHHPILGYRRFHNGLDLTNASGTPVVALADGIVVVAGPRGGYGNTVVVDHGAGFTTLSAHLSLIDVSVGTPVVAGQLLGRVGSTGRSTGPHLHFETRLGGVPVDPRWFVPVLSPPQTAPVDGALGLVSSRDTVAEPIEVAAQQSAEVQIERLYLAAFGRTPSPEATDYWVSQCERGLPMSDIAERFVETPEFSELFGPLDDELFVAEIYLQVLGRAPGPDESLDAAEVLSSGAGRGRILAELSESEPHQTSAAVVLGNPGVRRLYLAILGREPDASGSYYWTDRADEGAPLEQLAEEIGNSPEYRTRFGATNDEEFVARIYELVFDRGPDAEGLEFWVSEVSRTSRWSVLVGFTESPEGLLLLG